MDSVVFVKDNKSLKQSCKSLHTRKKIVILSTLSLFVILVVSAICLAVLFGNTSEAQGIKEQKNQKQELFRCGTLDITEDCNFSESANCNVTLLESIPENLTYTVAPSHLSIFKGWLRLLDAAESTVYIASSYWSLRSDDVAVKDPSSWQGEYIFRKLVEVAKRGVKIRIVHQVDSKYQPNNDPKILQKMGLAEVRVLDMERLIGAGILHSKMWLVDNKHFYLGSANMDWRSLTQIKELGVQIWDCSCLANDMSKIYDIYWKMAQPNSTIPDHWPESLDTVYNKESLLPLIINGDKGNAYLSSSPPPLCTSGRTTDIDSILDVIRKAKKFIHISVMDYSPTFLYSWPKRYWAVIDDALREAAYDRRIEVHIMASDWEHTKPSMIPFLKSIAMLDDVRNLDVQVRLFKVPANESQARIPYSRVQHTKYMVTDNAAYVGTSNWSADYFVSTAGIGLIINQTSSESKDRQVYSDAIQKQLDDVFLRDWNSQYTTSIWDH